MSGNPLSFGKQLYDISMLFEYADNFEEIFNAFYDVFTFEKESRSFQDIKFENVIQDLIEIGKLFSLTMHIPEWIQDKDIIAKSNFLKRGISGLTTYTSTKTKLGLLKTRTISAKIAFLAKLMLLKYEKNLNEAISMDIFQEENLKVYNLIQDIEIINKIIDKLQNLNREEKYHIQLKELKKIDPIGLLFWFGCYFPEDFLEYLE